MSLRASALRAFGVEIGDVAVEADGDGRLLSVRSIEARGRWGSAAASGTATLDEGGGAGRLEALDLDVRGRRGALRAPLAFEWTRAEFSWADLDLAALGGTIRGRGRLGKSVDVVLKAEGVAVDDATEGVDARVEATGAAERPSLSVEVGARRLGWGERGGPARLRAVQDDAGLRVEELQVAVRGLGAVEGRLTLPFSIGLSGVTRVEGAPLRGALQGSLAPEAFPDLPVGFSSLAFSVDARDDALSGSVRCAGLAIRDVPGGVLRVDGETVVEIASGKEGTTATVRAGDGRPFQAAGTLRTPVGWDASRPERLASAASDAAIEGSLRGGAADLSP
ncbi:MAG: hypothetical protein ACREID_06835, partial [Planctomycetota bacterium]